MWNNGDDYSDNGDAVKLFIPSQGPPRKNDTSPVDSHIGGYAADEKTDVPSCAKCKSPMFLFVQLRTKEGTTADRFLSVYGCPRSDCFSKVTFEKGFSSGGQGVMCCKRRQKQVAVDKKPPAPVAPVKSSWYDDDDDDDSDNDWGISSGNAVADLESAVAAMEANLEGGVIAKPNKDKPTPKAISTSNNKPSSDSFRCLMLNQQDEPPAPRQQIEDDDVGNAASDDKIRNMLARYMAEEEDQDILAALQGESNTGGAGGGEEDERLSDEDRILLGFQDRLRRASRQVVRYARGGIPLWSIPSEDSKKEPYWTVPPCSCGAKRSFECQLLPSLLHILQVDKFAGTDDEAKGINGLLSNGMNWGSIAVFTCSNNCDQVEEILVVQETVDEVNEMQGQPQMDFSPAIAVVEDMEDDGDFQPDT